MISLGIIHIFFVDHEVDVSILLSRQIAIPPVGGNIVGSKSNLKFGRTNVACTSSAAADAIFREVCLEGTKRRSDYTGNRILDPSSFEVKNSFQLHGFRKECSEEQLIFSRTFSETMSTTKSAMVFRENSCRTSLSLSFSSSGMHMANNGEINKVFLD